MTDEANWKVPVGKDSTSAVAEQAPDGIGVTFICAHGAGGGINDRSTVAVTRALLAHGIDIVRFNFLYKERGSGRPDQMPKLEECLAAVVECVRDELNPRRLVIGGRSMGGRAASMMAAKDFECDGLLLLAYPLHPPGQPEKLRDAHLSSIKVPVLCFCGTRDPFCTPELMERAIRTADIRWEMHWLPNADHSFHVPKSSGTTDKAVLEDVAGAARRWAEALG